MSRIRDTRRKNRSAIAHGRRRLALAAAVAALWQDHSALAGTDNWIGGTSDWNTPSNWDSEVVPGAGDTVNILSTLGAVQTITYDYPGPNVSLAALNVNASGGGGGDSETVSMLTYHLVAQNEYAGANGGSGAFVQSGGTNTVGTALWLGTNGGSAPATLGSYSLSGVGTLAASTEYVGEDATGNFNQSGGSNSAGNLTLGYLDPAATGFYALSNTGKLSTTVENIGYLGAGSFNQSGGVNLAGALNLAALQDAFGGSIPAGSYTLSGSGSLTVSTDELIGEEGVGTFIQTGGTNSTPTEQIFNGTYNQSGGNNFMGTAGMLLLGAPHQYSLFASVYTLSGTGSLSAGTEDIGYQTTDTSTFNQSGGLNTAGFLNVGYSGPGRYLLGGTGSLAANNEYVGFGGAGSFIQSGGSNIILPGTGDNFMVGTDGSPGQFPVGVGSYTLSGTGFLSSPNEVVGDSYTGNFNQTGGINALGATGQLLVGLLSSGTYTISGGSIQAGAIELGGTTTNLGGAGGTGIFNVSGGSIQTGSIQIGSPTTRTGAGGTGTFNVVGTSASVNASGSITVYNNMTGSALNVSAGSLSGNTLNLIGSTYNQTGGAAIFSNITGTGTINLYGGIITLKAGGSTDQLTSLDMTAPGTLDFQLGGHTQGVNYDWLNVSSPAVIGGTLEVDLVNGFVPNIGDQFNLLTGHTPNIDFFTGVIGQFANLTSNNGLFTYTVSYGGEHDMVNVTVTSVPEPTSIALLALCAPPLLRRRRKPPRPAIGSS